MKIHITTRKPDAVQRFFSTPLTFPQKVTVKKRILVNQIVHWMIAHRLRRK